jgi:hypothetical protein
VITANLLTAEASLAGILSSFAQRKAGGTQKVHEEHKNCISTYKGSRVEEIFQAPIGLCGA